MKVLVTKSGFNTYWYAMKVGSVFDVNPKLTANGYELSDDHHYLIDENDCEAIVFTDELDNYISELQNKLAEDISELQNKLVAEIRKAVAKF